MTVGLDRIGGLDDSEAAHREASQPRPFVLTVNGGSSSLKFAVYAVGAPAQPILSGRVERIGRGESRLLIEKHGDSAKVVHEVEAPDQVAAAKLVIEHLDRAIGRDAIAAVGHRVVHGGDHLADSIELTSEILDQLRKISPLDPEHLPGEIALVEAFGAAIPGVPQVGCFDTGFHRTMPRIARIVPIPRKYWPHGIRRYGFHGLSYTFLMEELKRVGGEAEARGRVVLAHLGSGASLAAVRDGHGLETTMGFTPTSGLVMGTRSGDLDPSLGAFLAEVEGMTPQAFQQMVNHESGLLGVSETSADLRDLLARRGTDPRADEAFQLFCYRVKLGIGAMASAIGGLDMLVFSGGIGENSHEVRTRVCEGLAFLGITLDDSRNREGEPVISSTTSSAKVRVIATDEESIIARETIRVGVPSTASQTPHGLTAVSSPSRSTPMDSASRETGSTPLSTEELRKLDAFWRASNYLSVGQIYLLANPLLKEPLKREHIKPRLLGHWGTSPGLNFLYTHLNRVIKRDDLEMIYIIGPGHGGPSLVAHAYLEGTYSEFYPEISQDAEGMRKLFKQFSFPGGIPSHVAPETPGSIHEGGELGYALSHAFGAAFDNPDLIVACIVGDGEAETGPLATGWHGNKFLNPARDGCVLPILHLNGYKIANPCFLARIPHDELRKFFEGMGYNPYFVEGDEPAVVHQRLAEVLDEIVAEIRRIQHDARVNGNLKRPAWPMIIFRTPKGWTCPPEIDGKKCEGYWRSHQVPMSEMDKSEHIAILEAWMKTYRPEELFDDQGRLNHELAELAPTGQRRMSDNPHANGGLLLRDLKMPDFRDYAVDVPSPGAATAESARVMGKFLRDVMKSNLESRNFRLFSPDENNSNRWQDVLEVTNRCYMAEIHDDDDKLSPDGRVMEVLSEHQCQGWLEGYLLTGRHGFFSCYEAFIHIVDSMFNQHAKWLKVCNQIPWRRPIASFNYFLSSHVWRQDHNGFSHQDPGFIDHVVNKKAEVIRVYLPPDANCLLSVTDHCLRSRNYVNVVVAGKQPAPQWLTMDQAVKHCTLGLGIWEWASNDQGCEPDVVMACCGDVPTLETLAAVELIREHLPEIKVRVVNVVDLMRLQPPREHPHGLSDPDFDALFTKDKPIIFAYHGYPWMIHRLTYRRTNHKNLHVRGYKEEGTTTTPFDMVVLNDLDRFHLVGDVIDRLPQLGARAAYFKQSIQERLIEHKEYIERHGDDMPSISGWQWGLSGADTKGNTTTEGDNV